MMADLSALGLTWTPGYNSMDIWEVPGSRTKQIAFITDRWDTRAQWARSETLNPLVTWLDDEALGPCYDWVMGTMSILFIRAYPR
jgi:hypothetical protein